MSQVNIIEICQTYLFEDRAKIEQVYDAKRVERVMHIREMYTVMLDNPSMTDKQFVEMYMNRFGATKTPAYQDLAVVKALLPRLSQANRDFHRWRANQMFLETYERAKKRQDTKTMERVAADYAKFNRVDVEDEQQIPWEKIMIQPFIATSDPSVLGLKPIPNLRERISALEKKYNKIFPDMKDIEVEEVDLREDELYPITNEEEYHGEPESDTETSLL